MPSPYVERYNVRNVEWLLNALKQITEENPEVLKFTLAGPFQEIKAIESDPGDYAERILYFTNKAVGE